MYVWRRGCLSVIERLVIAVRRLGIWMGRDMLRLKMGLLLLSKLQGLADSAVFIVGLAKRGITRFTLQARTIGGRVLGCVSVGSGSGVGVGNGGVPLINNVVKSGRK